MNYKLIFAIILTFVSLSASAQRDSVLQHTIKALNNYAQSHPVEKVHLHIDRQLYFPGDTIWFEAYTVIGPEHKLSALSNILYAELIDPKDSVVKRLTLGLQAGTAPGDFELPYNAAPGAYRIRAYTNWMRNFGPEYFFDQRITVSGFNTLPAQASTGSAASDKIDLQFFPEGGDLINGLRSKVAFKAINKHGLAEDVQGSIVDDSGNEVASFASTHLGMGAFPLEPQAGKRYLAKVIAADGSKFTLPLPEAKVSGYTLTINNSPGDSLFVKVAASETRDTAFYLIALHDGQYDYAASGKVTDKPFIAAIAKSRFQTGIEQFTLFSQRGEPLSERVAFIQNDDQLHLTVTTDKQNYAPGEEVKVSLEAKDNKDNPLTGVFSAAVVDESKVPVDELNESNILADLLLKSEISGHIEQPNYYFIDPNNKTKSDLDLLMLTQGYRRFEWKKISSGNETLAYQPEKGFSILGSVTTLAGKPVSNGKVVLTSLKHGLVLDTLTDATGRFIFENIAITDTATLIIDSKKANGDENVKTTILRASYPIVQKDKMIYGYQDNHFTGNNKPTIDQVRLAYASWRADSVDNLIQLKEVEVKDHKTFSRRPDYNKILKYSANLNGPGHADQVYVAGEDLLRFPTLTSALQSKLNGVRIHLDWKGEGVVMSEKVVSRHLTGELKAMVLYVNGTEAPPEAVNWINPADVYSVEVLTSAQYLNLYGTDATNGALIITLKNGSEIGDKASDDTRVVTYRYKGFYKSRQFYSPKYSAGNRVTLADNRRTVYWQPGIVTDADGKASLSYFNAAGKADCRLIVQGIGVDGKLAIQFLNYKVVLNN